jgi:hypothetical protein
MRATVRAATDVQAAVDAWLAQPVAARRAVVVEGGFAPVATPVDVPLLRLTPGCPCCESQVPLRVALVRFLRAARPDDLLLLMRRSEHAARVQALLADGSLGVRFAVDLPDWES